MELKMNDDIPIDDIYNRRGIFEVTQILVDSGLAGKVLALMEFTPVRLEVLHLTGKIEYSGLSPCFEVVKPGEIIPTYHVTITRSCGVMSIGVTRVNET